MEIDQRLLDGLETEQHAILHFYDWTGDSATYGYFTDPYLYLNAEAVQRHGLQLARRPTGGGIIFHLWDLAFSVLIPSTHPHYSTNTLQNYAFINNIVIEVIHRFTGENLLPQLLVNESHASNVGVNHFCMARPTKYDVVISGRKVGGAAQRRTKFGFLHQGTLSLTPPPEKYLEDLLLPGAPVLESIREHSFFLIHDYSRPHHLMEARQDLRSLLQIAIKLF